MGNFSRYIKKVFTGAGLAFGRYPASIACALAVTGLTLARIVFLDTGYEESFEHDFLFNCLYLALVFGAILSLAAVTLAKARFKAGKALLAANDIYKKVVPVDVVLTTTAYNKIYNLPMSSGSWFSYSETEKSLCMVVNKEAESYFNTPYAVGNTDSSLSLTPFNVTGTVNDGKDIPTVYLDAQAVEEFLPNMWQVQNASVYWHLTKGLTTNQMYSSLDDILQDTIGGHIEYSGRSDIGDAYDSVLSMLQLGLLITSFLLLFVSVLGQINIGLSSLEQRTYELLIRRAIGASRINIVALVLGTQLVISIFVCIVSILLSILIVEGIGIFLPPDTPVASPAYPFFSAVVAVVASVTVALLGGLLPALKAAKLEPALALR